MLKNYFKIALRNLKRHKGYSFINVFGLALGVACFVLIVLYVQDERSYDRYHENADRVFRVVELLEGAEESSSQPFPVGETLVADFPHLVESSVRFFNMQAPTLTLSYEPPTGEKLTFNEQRFFFTDSTVFEVFDFELVRGNPATALAEPNTLVMTEAMAQKYFGDSDPIGQVVLFEGTNELVVTGILAEVPANSHFRFDFLSSFESLDQILPQPQVLQGWYWNPAWTYVLLAEGVLPATLEAQFPGFVQKYFPQVIKDIAVLYVQPLTDIHLHSRLDFEIEHNSDVAYVYIFSVIAIFILLIACINFVNLTTARSANRAREVGMRKALGAHRLQLVKQFLGESVLLSLFSVLVSLPLIWLLLPVLNNVSGKTLVFDLFSNGLILTSLLGVGLMVGLISGIYPAFFLSSYRPVESLKGSSLMARGNASGLLRQGLVVTQFTVSIMLIAGTIVAHNQLSYLRNAKLGFDKDQVVMVNMLRSSLPNRYPEFKSALLSHRNVRVVSISEDALGNKYQSATYLPEGFDEAQQFSRLMVHDDVIEAFDIEMAAGRGYSDEFATDATEAVIINEAMVRRLEWGSPEAALGKTFDLGQNVEWKVIGVTKDFHYASLHQEVGPFILQHVGNNPGGLSFFGRYLAIRIGPDDVQETMAFIEDTWRAFESDRTIEYFFLDEDLDQMYRAEATLGQVATAFSLLAILVACLGLFGLASFTAEQRTKEIGVRKILGASVSGLVFLFSNGFVKLVGLAALIAWPISYFALDRWIQAFAYQTTVGIVPLLVAGVLALAIAWLTVSYQSIKTAMADPVESLRYE
jgi:putative ABC transport system permease protein